MLCCSGPGFANFVRLYGQDLDRPTILGSGPPSMVEGIGSSPRGLSTVSLTVVTIIAFLIWFKFRLSGLLSCAGLILGYWHGFLSFCSIVSWVVGLPSVFLGLRESRTVFVLLAYSGASTSQLATPPHPILVSCSILIISSMCLRRMWQIESLLLPPIL